jgi:hypothetical protein
MYSSTPSSLLGACKHRSYIRGGGGGSGIILEHASTVLSFSEFFFFLPCSVTLLLPLKFLLLCCLPLRRPGVQGTTLRLWMWSRLGSSRHAGPRELERTAAPLICSERRTGAFAFRSSARKSEQMRRRVLGTRSSWLLVEWGNSIPAGRTGGGRSRRERGRSHDALPCEVGSLTWSVTHTSGVICFQAAGSSGLRDTVGIVAGQDRRASRASSSSSGSVAGDRELILVSCVVLFTWLGRRDCGGGDRGRVWWRACPSLAWHLSLLVSDGARTCHGWCMFRFVPRSCELWNPSCSVHRRRWTVTSLCSFRHVEQQHDSCICYLIDLEFINLAVLCSEHRRQECQVQLWKFCLAQSETELINQDSQDTFWKRAKVWMWLRTTLFFCEEIQILPTPDKRQNTLFRHRTHYNEMYYTWSLTRTHQNTRTHYNEMYYTWSLTRSFVQGGS